MMTSWRDLHSRNEVNQNHNQLKIPIDETTESIDICGRPLVISTVSGRFWNFKSPNVFPPTFQHFVGLFRLPGYLHVSDENLANDPFFARKGPCCPQNRGQTGSRYKLSLLYHDDFRQNHLLFRGPFSLSAVACARLIEDLGVSSSYIKS